jgi:8-oxo-dGTP diphosphatase
MSDTNDHALAKGYPTHIVAVGGLVRNGAGEVLLVRTPLRGWEFPGGQVEVGESLIDALKREVEEEAGVQVRVGALAGVYTNVTPPTKVMFGFLCEWVAGAPTTSEESLESAWFAPDEATRLVTYGAYPDRLRDLLEFSGRPVYRVYASRPYRVFDERPLD